MPSGIADFGATAWLSALFGIDADISGYYVALCSDEPGVASDGTILVELEPADPAYARQPYAAGGANWASNGGDLTTLIDIDFGVPTVDWGLVTHFALLTDAVDGDLYGWGEFLSPQYVSAGDAMVIPAGGVVVSLAAQDNSITV